MLIFISVFCIGIALLYSQGIAISKNITAITFVFRPGRTTDKATLCSCTGWIKHVRRFHESRTYEFVLDTQLSKGHVEVILLDKEKRQIMKLNQQSPTSTIALDANSRYYLRWEFKSVTGKCELHW